MAYIDQYTLSQDVTFQHRVLVAIATAAVQVQGEALGAFSVQHYQKRQALARRVISNLTAVVNQFAVLVCQNAAITTLSLDSDIQFTVNSLWDDIAGVDAGDG